MKMKKGKLRQAAVVELPMEVLVMPDHIVAVMRIDEKVTIGLRFISPEHLLTFCVKLLEKAAVVWPEDEFLKEFMEDRDGEA